MLKKKKKISEKWKKRKKSLIKKENKIKNK